MFMAEILGVLLAHLQGYIILSLRCLSSSFLSFVTTEGLFQKKAAVAPNCSTKSDISCNPKSRVLPGTSEEIRRISTQSGQRRYPLKCGYSSEGPKWLKGTIIPSVSEWVMIQSLDWKTFLKMGSGIFYNWVGSYIHQIYLQNWHGILQCVTNNCFTSVHYNSERDLLRLISYSPQKCEKQKSKVMIK